MTTTIELHGTLRNYSTRHVQEMKYQRLRNKATMLSIANETESHCYGFGHLIGSQRGNIIKSDFYARTGLSEILKIANKVSILCLGHSSGPRLGRTREHVLAVPDKAPLSTAIFSAEPLWSSTKEQTGPAMSLHERALDTSVYDHNTKKSKLLQRETIGGWGVHREKRQPCITKRSSIRAGAGAFREERR